MDEIKIIGFGFCLLLILVGVVSLIHTGGKLIWSWLEWRRVRRIMGAVNCEGTKTGRIFCGIDHGTGDKTVVTVLEKRDGKFFVKETKND